MNELKTNLIDAQWNELEKQFSGLKTDLKHEIEVQREAIPLIFVPGIMGSVLRRTGTNGEGTGADGLPNMRWNPSSSYWMWSHYSGTSGAERRNMLIGDAYNPDFLEVHNTDPVGNGFQGVASGSYHAYLQLLQNPDTLGPLTKIFDFPVFAFGYNWTDTNDNNGKKLSLRIDEIMEEAKSTTGQCEKVILLTHSMGGLVSRSASELSGAQSKILGIIHGVQPATGAAAAYWRVKAGFEGMGPTSRVLGNNAHTVTPILGNMPGGLELLPNKHYRDNNGRREWLIVTEDGNEILALPRADPYNEIYRVQGTGNEVNNPQRRYWGLIDPDLLDPGNTTPSNDTNTTPSNNTSDLDALDSDMQVSPWDHYLTVLGIAEAFQNRIGLKVHPDTYTFHGTGHTTADRILMEAETVWVEWDSYPKRGFRGRFRNNSNEERRALLQDPAGDGDGTVSVSSSTSLDTNVQGPPDPAAINTEHEPAYNSGQARQFSVRAIAALCAKYYEQKRGKKI